MNIKSYGKKTRRLRTLKETLEDRERHSPTKEQKGIIKEEILYCNGQLEKIKNERKPKK